MELPVMVRRDLSMVPMGHGAYDLHPFTAPAVSVLRMTMALMRAEYDNIANAIRT